MYRMAKARYVWWLKNYDLVTREKANRTLQDTEEFIEYFAQKISCEITSKPIRCYLCRKGIKLSSSIGNMIKSIGYDILNGRAVKSPVP
jgi:hypothetical protein